MLTSGKTPFAVGGETAIRRVGRVAECTSPLTRQAVRLRRFESSTLRNFIQNMEQTTIESRVASAILERNVGNIEIEGVTYEIAPPSIATLIVVSEFIASLPIVEKVENRDRKFRTASCAVFPASRRHRGDAYPRSEEPHRGARRRAGETLFVRSHQAQEQEENQDRQTGGTRQSHFRERPSDGSVQRRRTTASRHGDQQFFAITTSLSEANILKPTKEVVKG